MGRDRHRRPQAGCLGGTAGGGGGEELWGKKRRRRARRRARAAAAHVQRGHHGLELRVLLPHGIGDVEVAAPLPCGRRGGVDAGGRRRQALRACGGSTCVLERTNAGGEWRWEAWSGGERRAAADAPPLRAASVLRTEQRWSREG
jgi:hypothetical protein